MPTTCKPRSNANRSCRPPRSSIGRPAGMVQVMVRCAGPVLRLAAVMVVLAMSGCQQQTRFIDEGPPLLDLYDELSDSDRHLAESTMQNALETSADNASLEWRNPETGNGGRFTPTRTYQTDGGYFCRHFEEVLTAGGKTMTYEDNHACRADDGRWRFLDD